MVAYHSAMRSDSLTLPCFSTTHDVDWAFHRPNGGLHYIYSNKEVFPDFMDRFSVNRKKPGDFSLTISSVMLNDSGLYTCHENSGLSSVRHQVQVIVYCE